MIFKIVIFLPSNIFYKELEFEANNMYEAQNIGNQIFREEFESSGKKSGNYFIEPK